MNVLPNFLARPVIIEQDLRHTNSNVITFLTLSNVTFVITTITHTATVIK